MRVVAAPDWHVPDINYGPVLLKAGDIWNVPAGATYEGFVPDDSSVMFVEGRMDITSPGFQDRMGRERVRYYTGHKLST